MEVSVQKNLDESVFGRKCRWMKPFLDDYRGGVGWVGEGEGGRSKGRRVRERVVWCKCLTLFQWLGTLRGHAASLCAVPRAGGSLPKGTA